MKQAITNEFLIVDNPAEPVEFSEMLERNYTVNKPAIERKAASFVDKVLETGNPIAIAENLTAIKHFIKAIEDSDRLNDYTVEELNKSQGKTTLSSGTKVEKIEAGTKYNYSMCGDPVLKELAAQLLELQAKVKQREAFLKATPKEGQDILADGGEVVRVYPPAKTSTTTYKVTLSAKEPELTDLQDDLLPF